MRLVVERGSKQAYKLRDGMMIGRDPRSDIPLTDAGVSRSHARIQSKGDEFVIGDFGSFNGTFVNNVRLTGPYTLKNGDRVQVGSTVLVVEEDDDDRRRRRDRHDNQRNNQRPQQQQQVQRPHTNPATIGTIAAVAGGVIGLALSFVAFLFVVSRTQSAVVTPTATPTATATLPPATGTLTTTDTPLPTFTQTAVPSSTATSVPTWTPTLIPTWTPTLIPTWTNTLIPTATRTPVPPTWTPTATFTPSPTPIPQLVAQFYADQTQVEVGSCTRVYWHVVNAKAIYLTGDTGEVGVTGPDGSASVCPPYPSRTYILRVVKLDNSQANFKVTVSAVDTTPPSISNVSANPTTIAHSQCGWPSTSTIRAMVTDNDKVNRVILNYTFYASESTATPYSQPMTLTGGNYYQAVISADALANSMSGGSISYTINATDRAGNPSQSGPYQINVQYCPIIQ